jgi:alcohol dehydrogenase, propanol-preferring
VVNIIPVPTPGPNQFLVKIKSASLCHSDLGNMANPALTKPVTLGHEGVGHIVHLHSSVKDKGFKLGDAVGFLYILDACFECAGCMIHNLHCEKGSQTLQGFTSDGFFAEYALVDYHNTVRLDEKDWDLTRAAPVFCAGITTFNSIDSCNLRAGDWLGVIGCGGLGQIATQYAKAMGLKVLGIDVADANLDETKKQGADAVFNSKTNENYADEIKKLTGGGVHAAAIYTNVVAAFEHAPRVIRLGGTMMVIGIPPKSIPVSCMDLVLGKYQIKADSTSIPQRMQKAVDFTAKHRIIPNVEIRRGLDQLAGMVQEMREGKNTTRTAIVFD